MPEIPGVPTLQPIPRPFMSPAEARRPGETVARLGQEGEQIAQVGTELELHIRNAQTNLALVTAKNKTDISFNKYVETLEMSSDPDHLPDPEAFKEELKKAHEDDPKYSDSKVKIALDLYIDSRGEETRHLTLMRKLELQGGQFKGQLVIAQQEAAHQIANAKSPQEAALYRGDFELLVRGGAGTWISAKEAEIYLQQLDASAEDHKISEAIISENPQRIDAMRKETSEHPENFKHLPEVHFRQLREHLNVAYGMAKTAKDQNDLESVGDPVINQYMSDAAFRDLETGKPDLNAAAAAASTNPTLSVKMQDYVSSELKKRASLADSVQRKADKQAIDEFAVQAELGEMTPVQIRSMERDRSISVNVRAAIIGKDNQIKRENRTSNLQARAVMRQERLDKSSETAARAEVESGYLTKADIPSLLKKYPDLSFQDANRVVQIKAAEQDPYFLAANRVFQETVNQGIMTLSDYGKAQIALIKASQKDITGYKLIEFANDIVKPQNEKAIGEALDNIINPQPPAKPPPSKGWQWPSLSMFAPLALPLVLFTDSNKPKQATPVSREEYFNSMKNANPNTSDEEINSYLDKKGIK